ncbi:MAG TPA: efflux RND transporter permease subunit, partial [Kofleriaceae bacterium]
MLARFFANRPVFAWVITIAVILAGIASIRALPIAAYPDVALPAVNIAAGYPGASAETVENSVTQVLEQQLTGIDGLVYFSSSSNSSGQATINVTFKQGTNPDTAQVQVQNKVQQAIPRLPPAVQQAGIVVSKAQSNFLMVVIIYDDSDKATDADLADYLTSTIQDPIARVDGVGNIQIFGGSYAMRIWLDPTKLQAFSLMPSDVQAAIATQNVQLSAGKIGQQPSAPDQQLNATVTAQSKLRTPQQFRDIILKYDPSGATVRLGDVARVELGSEVYGFAVRHNRHPAGGFAVNLAPNANAMAVASAVKDTVNRLEGTMPAGWKVSYPFDTTKFIRLSILEVVKTLIEAIALVVIVMFVFLQSWRATLIPVIAVPVVLLGTFCILQLLGYTINTLTMFAMVLSIGLLVDDAIVVVENTERLMREEHLSPLDATVRSMKEITGALIGIATVLSAVFLPMAFFSGSTGVIYRQFSVTIVASMLLSVLVALTISPAMCASLLRSKGEHGASHRGPFGWFNRGLEGTVRGYQGGVARMLRGPFRWLVPYAAIVGLMVWLVFRLPTGFLPNEDQGLGFAVWTLPSGATLPRTVEVGKAVENHFLDVEKASVEAVATVAGFSFAGFAQNTGIAFLELKDWDQRPGKANTTQAVTGRAIAMLSAVRDAQIFALTPPPIQGLGQSQGFDFQLQAAGIDRAALAQARDQLLAAAAKDPRLIA